MVFEPIRATESIYLIDPETRFGMAASKIRELELTIESLRKLIGQHARPSFEEFELQKARLNRRIEELTK